MYTDASLEGYKNVNNALFHYLTGSNESDQKYNEDPQEEYPGGTMKIFSTRQHLP